MFNVVPSKFAMELPSSRLTLINVSLKATEAATARSSIVQRKLTISDLFYPQS